MQSKVPLNTKWQIIGSVQGQVAESSEEVILIFSINSLCHSQRSKLPTFPTAEVPKENRALQDD